MKLDRSTRFVSAIAASLLATAAAAESSLEREHATGDWNGARTRLHERGVDPFARYVSGVWGTAKGGLKKSARYEGYAEWGLDSDLEKGIGWTGGLFHAKWIWYHGGQPNEELIGASSAAGASNLEANRAVRFYTLYLQQTALDGALRFKAGQLAADDDFFVSKWASEFANSSFSDFTLLGAGFDSPVYPVAAPGVYASANLHDRVSIQLGVYTADVGSDKSRNWGFNWEFSAGAALFAEAALHARPFGLEATLTFGALVNTSDQENFEDGGRDRGLYGFYAVWDQTLLNDDEGEPHLGIFFRTLISPQSELATLRRLFQGGIVWRGPIPGRPDDVAGVAAAWVEAQSDFRNVARQTEGLINDEQGIVEIMYRTQLTPWLSLQPNLQVIIDPALARSTALVLGLRATIDF